MVRISLDLLRRRAEHNNGVLLDLQEITLQQQSIEQIELLGRACPNLKILYLQNNLIDSFEGLQRLKDLEYLNVALNNLTACHSLTSCEALKKLDLSVNFIDVDGIASLRHLQKNLELRELHLLGNPCTHWHGYRQFVVATLPQLTSLDGAAVAPTERAEAALALDQLNAELRLRAAQKPMKPSDAEPEVNVTTGTLSGAECDEKRPWCPATRILDHRESEAIQAAAEKARGAELAKSRQAAAPRRRAGFDPVQEGARIRQTNEGKWHFSMSDSGAAFVLDVEVGQHLDTSEVKVDIQPFFARLLIKGLLLQLSLPEEVKPEQSTAQRSAATGVLQLTMPKAVGSALRSREMTADESEKACPSGLNAAVQAQLSSGHENSRSKQRSVSGAAQNSKTEAEFATLVCDSEDPPALPGEVGVH